ncbi:serine protease [Streptomyces sp. NPDC000594]|uniref:serine protease n=1 Tax=Streptomyces sp. NPDC000594 TaxID=3154261 RepID=UPI0033266710
MACGEPAILVHLRDLAGRPRGTGFVADQLGTVVTSHESVDGLVRVVLQAPGERICLAEADAIVPLPASGLALVRSEGLAVRPVPISARRRIVPGTRLRLSLRGWHEARALGSVQATYTATDRYHLIEDAVELGLAPDAGRALRLGSRATGGPVLDATTGAALAVLGTALHAPRQAVGFAFPLRTPAAREEPLDALLRRNAATVPGYGDDLNLAAVLELTATSLGPLVSPAGPAARFRPVARYGVLAALDGCAAPVLALVGSPGTGRTTELVALAARRTHGPVPAPTVWLRGADLRAADLSVADAVARALKRSGRILAASGSTGAGPITPERAAHLAREAGRPLLVVLDGPEEMPAPLAHRLDEWTAATVHWLVSRGVRMVVGCRPEHWERAAPLHPPGALQRPAVRIAALTPAEADTARARYGLPPGSVAPDAERHPLALRLLAEVREALPPDTPGCPGRAEILTAHLDLVALRIAVRIAASARPAPRGTGAVPRGTGVRRLAATVAGRIHEAARRCLGPRHGELDRESFEELFPWRAGWAAAVLTEGVIVPAGAGYRFAHEEVAEWLQGDRLDLAAALRSLVHRPGGAPPAGLPARPGHIRTEGYVPPPPGSAVLRPPPALPVPRHRSGPVVQALLRVDRVHGPAALTRRLKELIEAAERLDPGTEAHGWAVRLLSGTLLGLPDPGGYLPMLRLLATRIAHTSRRAALAPFDPSFWLLLPLPLADRLELLRLLLPADRAPDRPAPPPRGTPLAPARRTAPGDHGAPGDPSGPGSDGSAGRAPRYLDAVVLCLEADPAAVQPLLCRWFTDRTPLPGARPGTPWPTVGSAAQAVLWARRTLALDDLADTLVDTAHPRATELLLAFAENEPSALCRAVDRWAHGPDPRRRAAAAGYARAVRPRVTTDADRRLLRYAAYALLEPVPALPRLPVPALPHHPDPQEPEVRGSALALLLYDPHTRDRALPTALAAFAARTPGLPPDALATALADHPEQVLAAFRARLLADEGAAEVVRTLARPTDPAPARRAAALVAEYLARHPEGAPHAAVFADRRLDQGPRARAVLFPLVSDWLREGPGGVRAALAPVLAAPGRPASRPLRAELLGLLLDRCGDRAADPGHPEHREAHQALDAVLRALALGHPHRPPAETRELLRRTAQALARTPEGVDRLRRRVHRLAEECPGFASVLAPGGGSDRGPEGGSEGGSDGGSEGGSGGGPVPMPNDGPGHGSLRPA